MFETSLSQALVGGRTGGGDGLGANKLNKVTQLTGKEFSSSSLAVHDRSNVVAFV